MKKTFLTPVFLAFSASTFAHSVNGRDSFNYRAADLSSPAAIEVLHGKIKRFARTYCNVGQRTFFASNRLCFTNVEEEVVEKINDARLTAYALNR